MQIEQTTFQQLTAPEGLVFLGCDGDLNEWVAGVSQTLYDDGITESAQPEKLWSKAYTLTTTGGRVDLVLMFNKETFKLAPKLAMWRLRFGDCSWYSDYIVNYEKHHESNGV